MAQLTSLLNKLLLNFLSSHENWKIFNSIQEKAIPEILNKNDSLIIAPTASGKTEAALIPIFNDLISQKSTTVSVIYVAPLKALINDMELRIGRWCKEFNLTLMKWHGDVSYHQKQKFIKNPTDFLLITPESLEVIMINQDEDVKRELFKNIEYFIIDEIHYFADSDRGVQLNSLINRLSKYSTKKITKIGLSATVGNPKLIADWISNEKPVKIIEDDNDNIFQYKVWDKNQEELGDALKKYVGKKILIFVNSRTLAEDYYNFLKKYLNLKNIFIHHASMDKQTRESNENQFKNLKSAFMISTSTLELGIDIGSIDVVVQLEPPYNMSSFLQRIGRSGRKVKRQRSIINTHCINILVTLAEVILKNENKIEDIHISNKSKDILFHQILSCIFEKGRIKPSDIYDELTKAYVFKGISENEFYDMLNVMKKDKFIYYDGPFVGLYTNFDETFGRKNFMEFFSVFPPNYQFTVKNGMIKVGKLDASFAIGLSKGSEFYLGGKKWIINKINKNDYIINVSQSKLTSANLPKWISTGSPLTFLIARKTFEIVLGEFSYKNIKTFDENALTTLNKVIFEAKQAGFKKNHIPIEIIDKNKSNEVYIYSFAGNKVNSLLSTLFKIYYPNLSSLKVSPFSISFNIDEFSIDDAERIMNNIEEILSQKDIDLKLSDAIGKFNKNKFIKFLPVEIEAEIKNEILFDKENLIKLCKENDLSIASNFTLKNWL